MEGRYSDWALRLEKLTGLASEFVGKDIPSLRELPHRDDPRREASYRQALEINQAHADRPLLCDGAPDKIGIPWKLRRVVVPPARANPMRRANNVPNARDPRRVKINERAGYEPWEIGPPCLVENELVPAEDETCSLLVVDSADWPHSKHCFVDVVPHECNVQRACLEAGDEPLADLDSDDNELEVIAHPGYTNDLLEDRPMLEDDLQSAAQPLSAANQRVRRISDDGVGRVKAERHSTHKPVPRIDEDDVDLVDLCSDDEGLVIVKVEPLASANRKPRVSDVEPEIVLLSDDEDIQEATALEESPDCSEMQQVEKEQPSLGTGTRKDEELAETIATSLQDPDVAEIAHIQRLIDKETASSVAIRENELEENQVNEALSRRSMGKHHQGEQAARGTAQRQDSEPIDAKLAENAANVKDKPRTFDDNGDDTEPEIVLLSDDEDREPALVVAESLQSSKKDSFVATVLGSLENQLLVDEDVQKAIAIAESIETEEIERGEAVAREATRRDNEEQQLAEAIAKILQDATEEMRTQQLIDEETALRVAIREDELDDLQLEETLARSLEEGIIKDVRDCDEKSEQIAATYNEIIQSTRREPDANDTNASLDGEADKNQETAPTTNEIISSIDIRKSLLAPSVENSDAVVSVIKPNSENAAERAGRLGKQTDERSDRSSPDSDGNNPIEEQIQPAPHSTSPDSQSRPSSQCSQPQSCCSEEFRLFLDYDSADSDYGNVLPEELATDCSRVTADEPLVDRAAGVTDLNSSDRGEHAHEHPCTEKNSPPRVDKCQVSDFASLAETRVTVGDNKENVCASEAEKNNGESSCSQQREVSGALRTNNRDESFKRKGTTAPQKELKRTHRKRKRRRHRIKRAPDHDVVRKFGQLAVRVEDIFPNDDPVHVDNLDASQPAKRFCASQELQDSGSTSVKSSELVISGAFCQRVTSLRPFKRKLNEESVVDTFKRPRREFTLLIKDDHQTSISFTFSVLARYYEYAQRTFNCALFFYKHYGAAVSFNFLQQAITANEAFWSRRLANWSQDEGRVHIADVTESQTCDISKDEIPSVDLNCNRLDSSLQYTDDLNSKCLPITVSATRNEFPAKRFRSSSLENDHVKLKFLRDPNNKDSWKIFSKPEVAMDKEQDSVLNVPPSSCVDKSVPELESEEFTRNPIVNMQYSRKLENCLGDSLKKKLKKRSISFTGTSDEVDEESKKKRLINTKDSTKEKCLILSNLSEAFSQRTERKTQHLADSLENSSFNSTSDLIINNSSDDDSGQCSTINEMITTEDNVPDIECHLEESIEAHNSNIQKNPCKENESCDVTSEWSGSEISKDESRRNEHIISSDSSKVERILRKKLRMNFGEDSDEEFIEQELKKLIYLKHRRKKKSKIPECHADDALKENSNFQLGFSSNSKQLTNMFKVSLKCKQNELITATVDVDNNMKKTGDELAMNDTIPSSNNGIKGNENQVMSKEPELEEGDLIYFEHTSLERKSKSDAEEDYYMDSDNEQSSNVAHGAEITSQPPNLSDEDDDVTFMGSHPSVKKESHQKIKRENVPEAEIITLDSDDEEASSDCQNTSIEDQNIHTSIEDQNTHTSLANKYHIEDPKSSKSKKKMPDRDNQIEHDMSSRQKMKEKERFKDLEDLILSSCGVEEESLLSKENDVEQSTKSNEYTSSGDNVQSTSASVTRTSDNQLQVNCSEEPPNSLTSNNLSDNASTTYETDKNKSSGDISTSLDNNNHSEHKVVKETVKVTGDIEIDLKNSQLLEHFNLTMETSAPENTSENGLFDQTVDEEQKIVSEKLEALTKELAEKTEEELSSILNCTSKSLKVRNIDELLQNPQKCAAQYPATPASSSVASFSSCPPQQNLTSISALRLPNQQPTPMTNSVEGRMSSVNLPFQSSIHQSQRNGHVRFEKASKLYGHLYETLSDIFEMNPNGNHVKSLYNEMNTLLFQLGQLSFEEVVAYYKTFRLYGTLTEEIFEKFHFKLITVYRCLRSLYTYAKDKDFNNFMQKMKRGTEFGYLSDVSNVCRLYDQLKSEGFISDLADNTSPHFLNPVAESSIEEIFNSQLNLYYTIVYKNVQQAGNCILQNYEKFQRVSRVQTNNSRKSWTEMIDRFKTVEEKLPTSNANMIWNQKSPTLSSNMSSTSTVNNQINNSKDMPSLALNGNAVLDKSSSTSMTGASVMHSNPRVPEKTSTSEATVMEKNPTSQNSLSSCTPLLSDASTTNKQNNRVLEEIPSTSKANTMNEKAPGVGLTLNATTLPDTLNIVKNENNIRTENTSIQVTIKEEALNETNAHCYKCKKLSTIVCGDCENVAYCSAKCQLSHWKEHFISCRKSS